MIEFIQMGFDSIVTDAEVTLAREEKLKQPIGSYESKALLGLSSFGYASQVRTSAVPICASNTDGELEAMRHSIQKPNTKRKRKIISFPSDVDRFSIDALDYRALERVFRGCGYHQHHIWDKVKKQVSIEEDDNDRRVQTLDFLGAFKALYISPSIGQLEMLQCLDLKFTRQLRSLPDEIGDLKNLVILNLNYSGVTTLPPSIGQLQKLQELYLKSTKQLIDLPEEFGNLGALTKFYLGCSAILSLPSSIGQLKNLEQLYLNGTEKLRSLPDEIGNLGKLTKLYIGGSGIMSLPSSIGNLKNLQEAHFGSLKQLRSLPNEIGNIGNLIKLNLCLIRFQSLPRSIIQLEALEELDLSCANQLQSLPEEIGNLRNLVKLALVNSGVTSLPTSIESLSRLRFLKIAGSGIPELNGSQDIRDKYVKSLLQRCASLGWIDASLAKGNEYLLACNRFRSRTAIAAAKGTHFVDTPGWPILLENATHAFRAYDHDDYNFLVSEPSALDTHDVIYRVLADYRKPFVEMLIDCTQLREV